MFTLFTMYVISRDFFLRVISVGFSCAGFFKVFKYFTLCLYTFKKCHPTVILPSPDVHLHRFSFQLLEVLEITRLRV